MLAGWLARREGAGRGGNCATGRPTPTPFTDAAPPRRPRPFLFVSLKRNGSIDPDWIGGLHSDASVILLRSKAVSDTETK